RKYFQQQRLAYLIIVEEQVAFFCSPSCPGRHDEIMYFVVTIRLPYGSGVEEARKSVSSKHMYYVATTELCLHAAT
ncbi:unnamed protein product, partial [Urochloa humidicola]